MCHPPCPNREKNPKVTNFTNLLPRCMSNNTQVYSFSPNKGFQNQPNTR